MSRIDQALAAGRGVTVPGGRPSADPGDGHARGATQRCHLDLRTAQLSECLLTWLDLANRTLLTRAARYERHALWLRLRYLHRCHTR